MAGRLTVLVDRPQRIPVGNGQVCLRHELLDLELAGQHQNQLPADAFGLRTCAAAEPRPRGRRGFGWGVLVFEDVIGRVQQHVLALGLRRVVDPTHLASDFLPRVDCRRRSRIRDRDGGMRPRTSTSLRDMMACSVRMLFVTLRSRTEQLYFTASFASESPFCRTGRRTKSLTRAVCGQERPRIEGEERDVAPRGRWVPSGCRPRKSVPIPS